MKKLHVRIHHQQFDLVSRGAAEDAIIQETAQRLSEKITLVRREFGFPDNARATALAALLLALEGENTAATQAGKKAPAAKTRAAAETMAGYDTIAMLIAKIEGALARTADSPAEAPRNSLNQ